MKIVSLLLLALCAVGAAHAQELPRRDPAEKLEFEPALLLEGTAAERLPEVGTAPADVTRAAAALERAERKAARWQQLCARGVVSKLEAETAALQVLQSAAKLAALRAQDARQQLATPPVKSNGEDPAPAQLGAAEAAAAAAREALQRAKADAAQLNFERQRQLCASGLISKKQLQRAADAAQSAAQKTP